MKKAIFRTLNLLNFLKKNAKGYAIITYHDIISHDEYHIQDPMTLDLSSFVEQLNYFKRYYSFLSLSEITNRIKNKIKPKRLFIGISFDDGYLNQFKNAIPQLEKLDIPATFFITSNFIDQKKIPYLEKLKQIICSSEGLFTIKLNTGIKKYDLKNPKIKDKLFNDISNLLSLNNDNDNIVFSAIDKYSNKIKSKRIYMNWEEVKEISNSSLFEIGAHSISHTDLTKISKTSYKEIAHSKKIIENKINQNVNLFAYPYGTKKHINSSVISDFNKSSYEAGFSSILGLNNKSNLSLSCLNRIAPLGFEKKFQVITKILWSNEINKFKKY